MDIHAAVRQLVGTPPHYELFDLPAPTDEDQEIVDVLAVGLQPRVRTGASGDHYTSTGKLRWSPASTASAGVRTAPGVLRRRRRTGRPDGHPHRHRQPATASRSPTARTVVKIAAAMNPAMSSGSRCAPGPDRGRAGRY